MQQGLLPCIAAKKSDLNMIMQKSCNKVMQLEQHGCSFAHEQEKIILYRLPGATVICVYTVEQ